MTDIAQTQVAELICTRISHDLIGNIGSISNALELMEDDPSDITDVTPILKSSASTLIARLKFFRLAFGLKNAAPKNLEEMQNIAQNYIDTIGSMKSKISILWQIKNISLYKIAYLSIMALCDTLIKGGHLEVLETNEALSIKAKSDFDLSLSKLENMQNALMDDMTGDNPALMAPIVYLKNLVGEVGVEVSLAYQAKEALLSIR